MSNFMKNAKTWLGLGNDPYYDDYSEADEGYLDDDIEDEEPVRPTARPRAVAGGGGSARAVSDWEDDGGVRVIAGGGGTTTSESDRNVVRPLPSTAKPLVVSPTTFNDVQEVADCFKRSQPVIVNLQGVDRDLSRRLIDFASGLCYGLEGNMERVADQVFLLTPAGATVSDDERRRIREHGLVDER
jgi:cell division inhibitor SepF